MKYILKSASQKLCSSSNAHIADDALIETQKLNIIGTSRHLA